MAQLTNGERLVVLETLMKTVIEKVDNLDRKFDTLALTVVTQDQYEKDLAEIRTEIKAVDRRRWIQNTLSAVLGAIMAVLVQGYFT